MDNPLATSYQGEQFLADPDERSGKRHALIQDPRLVAAAGVGSPLRQSAGTVRFGSPGAGSYLQGGVPAASVPTAGAGASLPEADKMHILERTHNKSTRVHSVQEVLQDLEDDDIPKVISLI